MPIYEFLCQSCHVPVEIMQKSTDPVPQACEKCGSGPMVKQLSLSSFALKGSGWYVTDFKGSRPAVAAGSDQTPAPAATSSTAAAPSAPAAKGAN
jgi:putative FmdB family regulatory protein